MNVVSPIIAVVAVVAVANIGFWVWYVRYIRRKYPLPADLQKPDSRETGEAEYGGYYLETRVVEDDIEKRRFPGWGLFARGKGAICLTARGLHFWRKGFGKPLWIPYFAMRRAEVGISKRMRIRGKMALEVDWELAGYRLRSVFMVDGGVSATVRVAQWLQARIQ